MIGVAKSRRANVGGWRIALWSAIGGLLLLPLVAMRFTTEVRWDGADFIAAALLLAGSGLALELIVRTTAAPRYRAFLGAGVVLVAGLIWADAAVGIV